MEEPGGSMGGSIILKNVSKSYNSKVQVLKNFNYTFDKNLYLIIGPNGSGKTTLLNCITNYIRYKGYIHVDGEISYLPEKRGFDEDFKAKDLINMISKFYGVDPLKYIQQFSLQEHLNKTVVELSKGNKTKLYIICTLLKPANTYIFDEPTDGLDLNMNKSFREFCSKLSISKQVMISTHDLGFIDRLKDKAIILDMSQSR